MSEFFQRADKQLPSEFDQTFRSLRTMTDFVVKRHGGSRDDNGYLVMVDITPDNVESASWLLAIREQPEPDQGLYIVHESSLGIVVVFSYLTSSEREEDWQALVR